METDLANSAIYATSVDILKRSYRHGHKKLQEFVKVVNSSQDDQS